jgi:hypothetical protein
MDSCRNQDGLGLVVKIQGQTMRLTVNGVQVRVVDQIEIEIDVHEEGEAILNGFEIEIKGGPLTICNGSKANAMKVESTSEIVGCIAFLVKQRAVGEGPALSFIGDAGGPGLLLTDSDGVPLGGKMTDYERPGMNKP